MHIARIGGFLDGRLRPGATKFENSESRAFFVAEARANNMVVLCQPEADLPGVECPMARLHLKMICAIGLPLENRSFLPPLTNEFIDEELLTFTIEPGARGVDELIKTIGKLLGCH